MSFVRQQIFTGRRGFLSEAYNLNDDDVKSISKIVTDRVNKSVGSDVISGVGSKVIRDTLENVRSNYTIDQTSDTPVFEQIVRKTIDIISKDAIAYYISQQTDSTRTIWTTVDRSYAQNVNGTGMIRKNPINRSYGGLRF